MKSLYIWGAGGHGKVVFDCAVAAGYEVRFIDDDPARWGEVFCGCPVFGPEALDGREGSIAIAIGDNRARAARYEIAIQLGWGAVTLVHPSAVVSPSAHIGDGSVILPGAVVNADAQVGRNCIVNSGAVVEHDCEVGEHTHLAPRSALAGAVRVGRFVLVGIGSAVLPGKTVGSGAVIAAGSVVTADVPVGITVAGVPARALPRKERVA